MDGWHGIFSNCDFLFYCLQLGFQWQCRFPRKKKPGPVRTFEERVEELIDYKARYGDALVPYTYPEGLGVWSHVIRYEYRKFLKGQKTTLTEERINTLKEVRKDDGKLESLVAFKEQCSENGCFLILTESGFLAFS